MQVYAAMLLGFLIEGDPAAGAAAAAALPGGSLQPIIDAIIRAHDFYTRTGAMTNDNRARLERLVASLRAFGDLNQGHLDD